VAKSRNDILFRYLADTKDLERGNKRARKSMGGVAGAAKSLGGLLAVTFGAREIVNFASESITAASDYTESINAVEVATGDASAEIIALGDTSAEVFGLSRTEVNDAATAFAGFAKRINETDVAGTFEDLLGRATDFASVFNIDVKDALDIFQSTLAGQSKPIRAFGKDTSAASVKTFALANSIGEVGREMTESEKVRARFGLLMQETDEVAGDFANTADELANKQRILTAKWKDAQIELGKKLLPAMSEMLDVGSDLIPVVTGLAGKFADLAADAGEAVGPVGDLVSGISDLVDRADDATGGAGFLRSALGQLGKNIISGPRDAVLNLRDAFIDVNEWMSDVDESAQRFADTLATSTNEQVDDYTDSIGDATDVTQDMADAQDDLADATNTVTDAVDKMRKAFSGNLFGDAFAKRKFERDLLAPGAGSGQTSFATGGVVGGPRGQPQLAVVHGGERVSTPSNNGGGGGVTINFNGVVTDPVGVAQEIQDLLDLNARVNGPV